MMNVNCSSPKLSIVTPVYNGENFIEFCIKNIISQYCLDVEHIIVDGGSTDQTVEIVQQYAEHYPHIRWVSEPDRGQSDAMNKGVLMARGEILGILNDDDFYESGVLNRICEIFKSLPEPSFVVGNCRVLGEDEKLIKINKPQHLKFIDLVSRAYPFPMNPSAYFYHRSLHAKIGLYDIENHYTMDLDFILRAVQTAHVKYLNETWGNYRLIQGTKTQTIKGNPKQKENQTHLFKKHRQSLSGIQHFQCWIGSLVLRRLSYFTENPQEILPSFKKKFFKLKQLISSNA
jgi:glycosyltransferase involved in cell wall biosynthesis